MIPKYAKIFPSVYKAVDKESGSDNSSLVRRSTVCALRPLHRIALESFLIAGWRMLLRSLNRLRFLHTFCVGSRQNIDQFHEAGVVRITNGGLAIWPHPFGMLEPQVVVNLLPKLGIGADLVRHGYVKAGLVAACRRRTVT